MDWQRLARANTHPLRVAILEALAIDGGRTLSPKELSLELQEPLATVNYHVTRLAADGLLELVGQRRVRGATEHFYRPASTENASQAGAIEKLDRERTTGLEPATFEL
jgi:hypothetical protein